MKTKIFPKTVLVLFIVLMVLSCFMSTEAVAAIDDIQVTGITTNLFETPKAGGSITFIATAIGPEPIYYKFLYRAGYGAARYFLNQWVTAQDFSNSNFATILFPKADNYVVIVRASDDPDVWSVGDPQGGITVKVVRNLTCLTPNPHRAIVSRELEEWHNWLDDGGFEAGETLVETTSLPGLIRGTAERTQAAARTGLYGYSITADAGEGVAFNIKAYTEKGDDIRFSFWARSLQAEISLEPTVYGLGRNTMYQPEEFYTPDTSFTIGSDWTEVSFETFNKSYEIVLLSLGVGPNTVLHIDEAKIEQHIFKMAQYQAGQSRIVGGIPVPLQPAAPLHIAVLIHIEDPAKVHVEEESFWQETSRMRELARVLYEHRGFLTIQPEEDWPMASEVWQPTLLADLVRDYNVVYSTHTHGPHCRDDEGRLRSYSDCEDNEDTPG